MKKIGSILVLAVFLMTLIPTMPTFAAEPTVYTEDFDSTFTANQFSTSQIFTGGQDNGTYSQSTDGYNGGTTAVNVKANGANVNSYIGTKALSTFGLSQDSAVVLTARFKFVGNSTANFYWRTDPSSNTNESWRIYGGDDGKYHLWSQTATDTLQGDKWYNISIKIDTAYNYTYIYDAETGEQVAYKKAENPSGVAGKQFLFRFYSLTDGGIIFDDAKMYCVGAESAFSLQEDGAFDSEKNTVALTFNQPVNATKAMFSIDNGATVESVAVKDFNTVIVKITGLSSGKTYSLNFSSVTSAAGTSLPAGTNSIVFKTPAKELYTEDFNGTFNKYKFSTSEIFTSGPENGSYSDGTADYPGGTYAIKLGKGSNTNSNIQTHTFETFGLTENTALIFNAKFKVEGTVESDVSWSINPNSSGAALGSIVGGIDGKYTVDGDAENASLTAGKWYNMSIAFYTTGQNEMIINDAVTGQMIRYKSATVPSSMATRKLLISTSTMAEGHSLTIAEAKMYCIKSDTKFNFVASASSEDGVEISSSDSITLVFDKPVFGRMLKDGTPTLNSISVSGGADVSDIKVVDFNKMIVTFSGLNYLTDYTLNYSGMKLVGGTLDSSVPGTLAFKTGPDPNNELTLKGDAVCSDNAVRFDLYSKSGANPTFLVAFYNGATLEGVEIFTDAAYAINAGQTKAITLNLTKSYTGTTAKLFAWEGISTMKPLMVMEDITLN